MEEECCADGGGLSGIYVVSKAWTGHVSIALYVANQGLELSFFVC
jgi:hypothetical protein